MTHKTTRLIAAGLLAVTATVADAALVFRPAPAEAGHHGRGPQIFMLNNGQDSHVRFWTPDLIETALDVKDGRVSVRPTGKDNYHVLVAEHEGDAGGREAAIRYVYFNGKPTGRSPAELTALPKTALEIVPDPLPREHWRYEGGKEERFVLRFKDQPLSGQTLSLATGNGQWLHGDTDAQGRVRFIIPDDFEKVRPGRQANRPAEFTLSAGYQADGIRYHTVLSAPYFPSPDNWQSSALGWLALGGGFTLGLVGTGVAKRRLNDDGTGRRKR